MKNTDKKNNKLRKGDGLVELFFTKLLSVIFYEKANSSEKTILPTTEGRTSLRSRQK